MVSAKRVWWRSVLGVSACVLGLACEAGASNWYPSVYGAGDEIGAANNLSPAKVLQAAQLVTQGKTYSLGIEVNRETPAYPPRRMDLTILAPGQVGGGTLGSTQTSYLDDIVSGWLGIGTQIDGLGHMGINHVYYNGFQASEFAQPTGLTRLGVEKIPPIATRGVLLDIAAYKGKPMLEGGEVITPADLQGAATAQGVVLEKGDVVLLHTGWLGLVGQDNVRFSSSEPGLGVAGAEYLASLGVVAVGADNWALEVVPFEQPDQFAPVHQTLLARNGVYILENIQTAQLAADRAYTFLFVLGQPKLTGAVQMTVNPVAIR